MKLEEAMYIVINEAESSALGDKSDEQMKILGAIEIVQAFYDIDKDEVLESLDEDGTYYGDYFELTKDENNEIAFCELFIDSTQEILDMINDLKALKNDQFVHLHRCLLLTLQGDLH